MSWNFILASSIVLYLMTMLWFCIQKGGSNESFNLLRCAFLSSLLIILSLNIDVNLLL